MALLSTYWAWVVFAIWLYLPLFSFRYTRYFCAFSQTFLDGVAESAQLEPQGIVKGSRFEQRFAELFRVKPTSFIAAGSGIAAFVLRYRTAYVPAFLFRYRYVVRGTRYPDAQDDLLQSLRYLRAHADEFGIDPDKIGVMGFSAGGHLVMSSVELFDRSEWPCFVVPVYPVVTMTEPCVHKRSRRALLGESRVRNQKLRDSLSLERHVPDGCPPVFLVNCKDDQTVDYHNSELLDSALTAHQVPHTYLQYKTGGHGFGASDVKGTAECRQWRSAFLEWVKETCEN